MEKRKRLTLSELDEISDIQIEYINNLITYADAHNIDRNIMMHKSSITMICARRDNDWDTYDIATGEFKR